MKKNEIRTKKYRTLEEKNEYKKRLNKIEGQLNGIRKMIEEDRICNDILIQISATSMAIKSLGQVILESHMKTCMIEDINNKKYESVDEIMNLCRKLM